MTDEECLVWPIEVVSREELKKLYPDGNQMDLRKLDALVAEKIMGCKIKSIETAKDQREFEYLRSHGNYLCGCGLGEHNDTNDEGSYQWLKNYSEEIAAAWEVVEKIKDGPPKDAEEMSATFTIFSHFEGGWICTWSWHEWNSDMVYVHADTAPLAICIAALKGHVDVSEWEK